MVSLGCHLDDPRQAVRMYRKRMQPEQYFKDGKQRFGLNRSTVTTTHRLQRLLVALLLPADTGGNAGVGVANLPTPSLLSGQIGHSQPRVRILPRHSRSAATDIYASESPNRVRVRGGSVPF